MDKFQALEHFHREILTPMGVSRSIVEDADLIVGARLSKSETSLSFDIRDSSTKFPYELRLNKNDIFLAYGIIGSIAKIDEKAGDWASSSFTYIEKGVFKGVKNGLKETDALRAVFGGTLNMVRDRVALIKDLKMRNLQFVPERQMPDGIEPNVNLCDATYYFSRRPVLCGDDTTDFTVDLGKISVDLKELIDGNINATGADMNALVSGVQANKWCNHLQLHFVGFRVPGVGEKYKAFRERNK